MFYRACKVESGTAYPVSPAEVAEVAWCPLESVAELVPYGLYGPVQRYLDDRLGAKWASGTKSDLTATGADDLAQSDLGWTDFPGHSLVRTRSDESP
jgi:hypothetical protein